MDGARRASRIRGALTLAVLGALVVTALVSPVGAALNKSKVKSIAAKTVEKLTYTESEADTRFINTGEKSSDAELLDGVDSGGFVRPQDRVLVSTGNRNWVSQSSGLTVSYATNTAQFSSGGALTDQFIGLNPDIPTALYGRSLELRGVEFCYSTPSINTTLDAFFLFVHQNSTDGIPSTAPVSFEDNTDRVDNACRLYTLPTPLTLTGEHLVGITARIDYAGVGGFNVARATFVLEATGTPAAPLARPGEGVVLSPAQSDAGEA